MAYNQKITLIGVGAQTAIGRTANAAAAAFRAGIVRIREHPQIRNKFGQRVLIAPASYIDLSHKPTARMSMLADEALQQSLRPLQGLRHKLARIAVFVGLPAFRPGLHEDYVLTIKQALTKLLSNILGRAEVNVDVMPLGHAAGLWCLSAARLALTQGYDCCLVGGIDSYLGLETLHWLDEDDKLHGTANAWGFVPGEAAGFCLVARKEWQVAHAMLPLAEVHACETAREPSPHGANNVCIGLGLSEAIRNVITQYAHQKINSIYSDMNGEPHRTDEWGFTIARSKLWDIDQLNLFSPANCWGDIGAASGPMLIILAIAAWQRSYARGPCSLIWCSSPSGERGAVLLKSVNQEM